MNNIEKLKKAFNEALEIPIENIDDNLSYGTENWDSVAHLALVASIETEFDIMFTSTDVIDMSSFNKAKEILEKYDIHF